MDTIASMRPAARLLLLEAEALPPVLEGRNRWDFDKPTILDGWTVRDVIAHCSAALGRVATGAIHGFTPEDNQADVDARQDLSIPELLEELRAGYHQAADAIDAANGAYDGVALGEWIHGGDIRDALGAPLAYKSAGVEMAVDLLVERSKGRFAGLLELVIDDENRTFGNGTSVSGRLETDAETFIRLAAGRGADPDRYELTGATANDLVLFR